MSSRWIVIIQVSLLGAGVSAARGGVIFGHEGLSGGYRWDAAPRVIGGNERSLAGGLRYSVQGGSFEAYRDLFRWETAPPTVAEFQGAVQQAFAAWEAVDPATGLHTDLSFVADLSTPVAGSGTYDGLNLDGAEIDLLAGDAGMGGWRGVANLDAIDERVALTSGTPNYPGSSAIAGVDVTINNNSGATYTLDRFRRLLSHEIGHALGLGDVEAATDFPDFIDDDYDGSTSSTAAATLTNSWAMLVNPLDPAASPLSLYVVPSGDPGIRTPGVDILMESVGLGIAPGNPVTALVPLSNDDFGTRQFLYPSLARDVDTPGDYNDNGVADAADYTVWRDHLNALISLPNETATFGTVTYDDYVVWKENLGSAAVDEVVGSSADGAALVPEASIVSMVIALGTMAVANRRWPREVASALRPRRTCGA